MWVVYAFLAAVFFGVRGILYHWTSQRGLDRNLTLFGVFTTGAVLSLAASLASGQRWTASALIGIAMGAFSFAANASLYKGFAVGKASLVALLSGMPPAVVVAFAYFLWGETLTALQGAAFGLLLLSVALIRYSNEISLRNLQGVQWGLLAMFFFGFTDLASKQSTLAGADPLPTLFFMFLTGSSLFCASWLWSLRRAGSGGEQRERVTWGRGKTFLWGMAVGLTNAGGMIFLLRAFVDGITGLVSAVVAMNILLILAYTRVAVKVPFKRMEIAGIALAFAGMLLLRAGV